MPPLLSSILTQTPRKEQLQHLLILQSSAAQTCLPVLRAILKQTIQRPHDTIVLFCFLYHPSSFIDPLRVPSDRALVVDKTASVPGYDLVPESEQRRTTAINELLHTLRSGETCPISYPQ